MSVSIVNKLLFFKGQTMHWKLYFERIQTQADYWALRKAGFMYEFFIDAPASWQEHLKLAWMWEYCNKDTEKFIGMLKQQYNG